jgi:hypothetical protein
MRQITPDIHVFDRPLRFYGIELGTRMTVIKLSDGLLIHSPIDVPPDSLSELGEPRYVLAPNKFHHLFVAPWVEAGIEGWAAPGLMEKRKDVSFKGVVETGTNPFGPEIEVFTLSCFPLTNEVVLYHKPSKTLILTDLLINLPPTSPWLTRVAMRFAYAYPGAKASLFERIGMNRKKAREDIRAILEFPFERIILAHGDIIETGAREAFVNAYQWLKI